MISGFLDYFGMVSGSRKHPVTRWHMPANQALRLTFAISVGLRAA